MPLVHRVIRRTAAGSAQHLARAGAIAVALVFVPAADGQLLAQETVRRPVPAMEAAPPAGDRIARLEAQLGDLHAMVAALQSLVKTRPDVTLPQESGRGVPSPAGFGGSALTARVDALETRIGALTGQIEMVTQQLGALQANLNGHNSPQPIAPAGSQDAPLQTLPGGEPLQPLSGDDVDRRGEAAPAQRALADTGGGRGFLGRSEKEVTGSVGGPQQHAALPGNSAALSLYNEGYNHFLSGDYEAAARAFEEVADRHPNDPITATAGYWLGEAQYVQRDFRKAAKAFLASFKASETGEKAPHSLLKLAMSLGELGKKEAACSTLKELDKRFPQADLQLQGQLEVERRKAGC